MVLMQTLSTFTPTHVIPRTKVIPYPIRKTSFLTNPLSLSLSFDSNPIPPLSSSLPRRLSICPPCLVNHSIVERMSEDLEIELKVREYELDQYGVVNNAVYSSYCQLANHELLRSIGLDDNAVENSGGALALSKLSLSFIAPLRGGDEFVVKSTISELSAARLFFDHFIYKLPSQEPILEAKAVIVLLDKNYRPVRIPSEVKTKSRQFMRQQSSMILPKKSFSAMQCNGMKP